MSAPRYDIDVQLTGLDGNAYSIMGRVGRKIGWHLQKTTDMTPVERALVIDAYVQHAKAGTYEDLINATREWVNIE